MTISIISLMISVIALGISVWNDKLSLKIAQTDFVFQINQLMLQKAKDCNIIWNDTCESFGAPPWNGVGYDSLFSELIISIQILDNCLQNYNLRSMRDFLILQLWIQLSTPIRDCIKKSDIKFNRHLPVIKNSFKEFFDKY